MIVINTLLAVLLFSRGSIEASGDATRLGTAYLFVALIFLPLVASFPGGIVEGSVIGTRISAVWLWSFWHAGFGLLIIRYVWRVQGPDRVATPTAALLGVLAAVAVMTVVSTVLLDFLPSMLSDGHTLFSGRSGWVPVGILAILAVALVLVCRLEGRTLEHLWLAVAMVAALFDVWLTYCGTGRFSLGWYLSKGGSLFTSLAILMTLLHEVTYLYSRAATSNGELQRLAGDLEQARDKAEHATRAKSRFVAGVSHELRTPLNGIMGYAQLLHNEGGLNQAQTIRIDAIRGAGTHLLEMINGVLDLSQIEAERLQLRKAEFDVHAEASRCVELMRPTADAKGLTVGISIKPGTPRTLFTDATRLRQVLLNLIGNAVKFTRQGTVDLRLSTLADGSALRIEVADTGPGIPPEQRRRLFQDYDRLDLDTNATVEGAGLGLSLSNALAALMDGGLGYADNPGGGSVFWLELPLAMPAPLPQAAFPAGSAAIIPVAVAPGHDAPDPVAALPTGEGTQRTCRVLVVDDTAMTREITCAFLQAAGHQTVSAEGGAQAVEVAGSNDFHVVLMDVRMPGVDGLEATRRIRALGGSRGRVPIVAVTGQVFEEQVAACLRAGVDSHLAKPFTQDALLDAVLRAAP